MENNLHRIEKDLRSIAKRYKSVKYSIGLAILFLMLGVSAFSEEVNTKAQVAQIATREELKTSVGDVQTKLNVLRENNKKEIKNLNLELVQLMEQGTQVVKSPWASWQFGVNYFHEKQNGEYKGRGDKSKKYLFNGLYVRGDWKVRNAMDALASQKVSSTPLTPGNDSLASWKNISSSSNAGVVIERNTAINSSVNRNRTWGLVDLLNLKEPTNEVEILARISPKEVSKQALALNITAPVVQTLEAPVVKPEPNKPIEAPKINLPSIKKVTIEALSINPPSAPGAISVPSIGITIATPSKPVPPSVSVSVNEPSVPSISVEPSTPSSPKAPAIDIEVTPPSISSLNIVTPGNVGTIGVTTPTVTAVDFILGTGGLSGINERNFVYNYGGRTYDNYLTLTEPSINVDKQNEYISTWGEVKNLDKVATNVNVNVKDTRAFMIDEGIDYRDSTIKPFTYTGTINLNASQNVGIDVQGTHTGYSGSNKNPNFTAITDVANVQVINKGNINGNNNATGTNKNQVAFGFNNFDSSTNNTRTEMINIGKVTLNAPESAGIQLRPENPNNTHQPSDQKGLNMMVARNEKEVAPNEITGTININSYGSFGMLTVKNKDATTSRNYNTTDYKTKTSVGGQFANRAQVENMSFMKNTGEINIDGDSSIGVGHLHNIQAVYVGGTINIGKNDPTNLTSANKGSNTSKTEGAVGVYTSVETRPVLKDKYDDHGLQNTTGATVGTETVEVFGTINLEQYAKGSIGLYAKDKGSITLKNNSTVTTSSTDENVKANINKGIGIINVGGENNYGAVVDTIKYKSKQKEAKDQYETESTTDDKIGRIDLERDTLIKVTGKESIGYVLKNGEGSNSGTIKVIGNDENKAGTPFKGSLGFYGEKGKFTNEKTGIIEASGKIAHAVALIGDVTATTPEIKFTNKGRINAVGGGNIGVYTDGKYEFTHTNDVGNDDSLIAAHQGAIGIYAKNPNGKLEITAPIFVGDSTSSNTTIGVYSDGDANVKFGEGSKLAIKTGAVGLYSADATKFKDTFKVESGKKLEVDLGTNSTFGLFNAASPTILKAGEYLENNTIDITSFGTGASIFYTTGGATTEIDKNYIVSNATAGTNASTSVLVGTKGSTVKVNNGINLTTGTNVGLIATKGSGTGAASSTAINDGVIKSTRVSKGIAIYTNDSTATNSATGSILMDNTLAVGMLGENNSTLTNDGKIELAGTKSTGIYGKDSDITNTGTGTTPQKGIFVKKEKSAGIYALLTAGTNKTVSNTGLIKLEGATETGSAGIYSKLTSTNSKLTTQNSGNIELVQTGSAGIYADNISTQNNAQSEVTNTATGLIKVDGESSVGIIGKKSKITNLGTGAKGIEVKAIKSAGILGNTGSTVINSARILLEANVTNSTEGLVGVSVDNTSTGTNDTNGTIEVKANYSSGMSSTGGLAKNDGKIQLINASTVGILSTNANVENNGLTTTSPAVTKGIIIENDKSVGIFARLNGAGSVDKTIKNNGTISVGGTSKKGSAGIYSILENGSTKKITTLNATTANIDVSQEEAVGIYVRNSSTQLNSQSVAENAGKIVVSSAGSAGILAYKSEVTNSGTSASLPTFDKGISLTAKKTAGIIGKNGSKIINTGDIVLNSTVQPTLATDGLVGISIDEISSDDKLSQEYIDSNGFSKSTATNDGTITINTAYSTGISGKGGAITNNKDIILNKEKSVGIASTDGNVLNSLTTGKIEVKESSSVGIFAKLTENATSSQTITNEGLITLNGGNTKTSSVGIYSLIEDKAVQANNTQTIANTGIINVGTKNSAGIYVKDNRTTSTNLVSLVRNEGTINITEESSAGIIGEYSQITNGNPQTKNGVIELSAKKTAGIIANKKSKVMNYGTIETTAFSVGIGEGLVGISADNSTVINKNKEDSAGMIGSITLNTAYSTGIYGKNNSILTNEGSIKATKTDSIGMAGENSLLTNKNIILLEEEKSVGMFGTTDDTDPKNTTVINQRDDNNNLTGTITTKKKKSVGIFVSTVKAPGVTSLAKASAINRGTILIEEEESAGMYGDEANIENTGTSTNLVASITTKKEKSAAMYAKNSNATNKKKITVEGKDSAGILVELTKNNKEITGTNDIAVNSTDDKDNGLIEIKNEKSVGMLGKVDSSVITAASKLTLFNKKAIDVDKESSVGMMLINDSTNVAKDDVTAENTGVITLKGSTTNKENIGILAKKNSTAINKDNGIINVNSVKSIGMLAQEGSKIENNTTIPTNPPGVGQEYGINLKAEDGVGMLAEGKNSNNEVSTATNNAKIAITSTAKKSIGMYAKDSGDVKNNKEIEVLAKNGVGIFVSDTGKGENTAPNGKILLENKETVGIFAKNNGNGHTAKNSGTINLGKDDGTTTEESLIGMFAQAESGKKASVKNEASGIINVNTKKSVGMYAQNNPTNAVGDVDLQNIGTININNAGSAGIYAPKTTVSKVGKINLKDTKDSDGSSAVYVSEGGIVADTSTAEINLGTANQNRVAYYVNGANSILRGGTDDNIGKISGYGVGVYLEGSSKVGTAELDKDTPKLHFTNAGLGTTGNGIIGLFLSGNTEVKDYTKGIVVGDTVHPTIATDDKKYAIGIYADKQGTTGSHYEINTDVTTGKEGVGIFSDSNSVIDYKGHITVGNGTTATKDDEVTAGIGIYITKSTAGNTGTVNLIGSKTDTSITLKGTGGVAVIASEDTKFDGGNATINLVGTDVKGVGVYAKKGSDVNIDNWTFNNNGNAAEEVRSEEGKANINATLKELKPKMVLSHVINGETSISSSTTVVSVDDLPYKAAANIGLMAEGIKNPAMTWVKGNYEIVNDGIINFSAADKSTAIYVNSARVKNNKDIKVGKNSTAIYGFYDKNTRKYDGAPTSSDPNKLTVETTATSNISLGDSSTGMYLINAETVTNATGSQITSTSGATKNVGIYAINGAVDKETVAETTAYNVLENYKKLTMTTATDISLGDKSVGLYSKGKGAANVDRNTVVNTGAITVGNTIIENKGASNEKRYPAVAIYAENTNLNTNSAIRVGNDAIAFYGKNSDITADGTVNFSNKGVLAYLENSVFISKLGNLGATQNTMLYLKDSTAQLDGAGTKVDIDVADGYTGAYISGNSHLTGVRTIKLGQGSTGLYLENTSPNFVSTAESITGTKDNARGIVAKNANFTNNSKISLSGKESVGIYSNADATKNVVNNGELTLSGKKTLGVFLRGGQTFENKANINIADSANSLEPTIGIYTAEGTSNIKHTTGTIEVGEKSIGIYSKTPSSVEMNGGKIHVKDQGIGIYKEDGTVVVKGELDIDKHVATAKDTEPTGVYAVNGATVVDQASKITVGEKSYGFILNNTDPNKTNVYTNTNAGSVSLGNDSVFLYSKGKANITNNRNINSNNSDHLIGFYVKDGGDFVNNGIIDFSTGKGNIGVYAPNGKATNRGSIVVGPTDDIDPATGKVYSDANKIVYGIGMAADNGGHIVNEGDIRISTNKSIGMYGAGAGTIVENTGRILLDGSQATATNKIQSLTGVYVDEGATFKNSGLITTTDSYAGRNGKINENVSGLTGVAVMNGSTLINEATGKILIDADNSTGVVIRGKRDAAGNLVRNAVIKNYGEIRVRGKGGSAISWKDVSAAEIAELERQINSLISTDPSGNEITQASGTSKDYQGITITVKNGQATFLRNGVPVSDSEVEKINKLIGNEPNLAMSDIGFYIDTLGRTRPVTFDGVAPPVNSQLIIGTEFSEMTNKKEWIVSGDVIKPFLDQIQGRNFKITTMAGSLTWMATPILDNYGQIVGMAMSKLAYTSFVRPEDNAYNFADGLEQRYDMNALDSAEKRLFNKLNGIGKNEDVLLTQAYDEMMGHQYANVQQRIQATGRILDKEFSYLRNSWSNPSKDSNKVKTFGMKGEYKTDTAGIIDYKNNAYGVAYVHEDETVKLGESTGWYTGIVHNTFKFEDIGKSKEEQLQAKVGLFKSVPFDDNNSLNWTISGDIFVGHNKLNRRFLVVDEIFQAKSKYYTYGIGVKNEVRKEFRLSEGLSVKPYGALRVEYGRMSKIKEKSGEMKLEVKSNDYLSIKPEVGTELAYKFHLGNKTLRAALAVAYENELGRVANGKNKARVAGTSADWFNIRGEKEDRRGNVKTDLNVGVDNQRIGVTGNIGYDTKGRNVRGGLGLRVIF
ncbi:autotransporter-associated N-terminal domain-containing protein [Fusobacterium pseudoperiodonticum]|uniref:Autotransporter domain-containing protein n=1 Tax=Fusobacterium pseudoperiodonticum TaxID=2663009 RepID=A0A2G9EEW8_9FUSO|nr:autotransporter-associated N-terminal domain-containing protein [Fusobacterium pseudoperiodonticum]PIM79415.1 autotransporter domain-containing protein [Fusobacterium pseudoperiodonticum]